MAIHKLPPLPAEPTLVVSARTYSTAPTSLPIPMISAEILIPPPNATFPTQYIYATNRNDTHPEGDAIAIFSFGAPDKLELVGEVRTGLHHLRGMQFGGPADKWLIIGGVHGPGVDRLQTSKSLMN